MKPQTEENSMQEAKCGGKGQTAANDIRCELRED